MIARKNVESFLEPLLLRWEVPGAHQEKWFVSYTNFLFHGYNPIAKKQRKVFIIISYYTVSSTNR